MASEGMKLLCSDVQGVGDKTHVSMKPALLLLEDGRSFQGYSFGYDKSVSGEVVFNTGMVGYPETLTDPSYTGQILTITYPLVGNYGVPANEKDDLGLPKYFEGDKVHVTALVVADYSFAHAHYTSARSLAQFLQENQVPGIAGIDTRALTKHIRVKGAMLGKILIGDDMHNPDCIPMAHPMSTNLVAKVSNPTVRTFKSRWTPGHMHSLPDSVLTKYHADGQVTKDGYLSEKELHIVAVDCGMKHNIIRHLVYNVPYKLTIKVVPWNHPFGDEQMDGLFISNGPGDPTQCQVTIDNIKKVMQRGIPIFGICLGNQLLALAAGAKTYKMKFGNRGMNQPCVDMRTTKCYITPQNHGFAVDSKSLPNGWMEFFVNANDQSNEGIIHKTMPWFSVQFHPEAAGGPTDTWFLFYDFFRAVANPKSMPVSTVPYSMPQTPQKVLLLGSGGLSIGQAGEFDYSGSQCIKALKEYNIHVILINPNIATVQTSGGMADKVYFLPVTPYFVEQVIKKERPDGLLCTFGGQTGLNCAVKLDQAGVLKKYNVRVLGTQIASIVATEDREIFKEELAKIGEKCAESYPALNVEEVVDAAKKLGYPVLVRAAFCLGGLGSGFANDEATVRRLAAEAFAFSDQVLVDKSLRGWKELEYEVVRDSKDNCITVCNMENFDPLGVHTGDSIVIAPSQTLSNVEYFKLRETAQKVIRHFQIVGECNIQYAVDPFSHEYRIVEVNARLSRSSALASKATGYPLAYVAAKLALGMDLVQVRNAVTKVTTACFEPSLDYCVVKIPRWDLKKFATADTKMGSAMKSVGEVMSIGRTYEEAMQKALRMVDDSALGFDCRKWTNRDKEVIEKELANPTPNRIWALATAFDMGYTVDRIHELTRIDKWFLAKLRKIQVCKAGMQQCDLKDMTAEMMRYAKRLGFSDKFIAAELKTKRTEAEVRAARKAMGVTPWVKQIDTLAAEYPAQTNYLYLSYQGSEHDVEPLRRPAPLVTPRAGTILPNKAPNTLAGNSLGNVGNTPRSGATPRSARGKAVEDLAFGNQQAALDPSGRPIIVLGCGCYRIGSSVEFDWSSMSCVKTLRHLGLQAIVVNCNPETVSTDYDESDRLFFEDLSLETVLDICDFENPRGVVVSVGGQAPNNVAMALDANKVPILGTSVHSIDMAEDRSKFSALCDELKIDQPQWAAFSTFETALEFANKVSFPVLVRPSYVLSGAAMRVVPSAEELNGFLKEAAVVSREYPVVISKYVDGAREIEFDGVAAHGEVVNYAISEHVENAGVHSGDATLVLPAQKLYVETIKRVRRIAQQIARALQISGPFNIQLMSKDNEVKVIECNLRASRSFPFISKTFNTNFIETATRIMVGAPWKKAEISLVDVDYVCVKAPMFSFTRLRGSDPVLGVEMRSTGEVACFGTNKHDAFLKSVLAAGMKLPNKNILLSCGPLKSKVEFLPYAKLLEEMGMKLYATKGTHDFLKENGVKSEMLHKPLTAEEPNVKSYLTDNKIDLVVNVPESMDSKALTNGFHTRRIAIDSGVTLITDIKVASMFAESIHRKWQRESAGKTFFEIKAWNEYMGEWC